MSSGPVEVLSNNVLRCRVPPNCGGSVPIYVMTSDGVIVTYPSPQVFCYTLPPTAIPVAPLSQHSMLNNATPSSLTPFLTPPPTLLGVPFSGGDPSNAMLFGGASKQVPLAPLPPPDEAVRTTRTPRLNSRGTSFDNISKATSSGHTSGNSYSYSYSNSSNNSIFSGQSGSSGDTSISDSGHDASMIPGDNTLANQYGSDAPSSRNRSRLGSRPRSPAGIAGSGQAGEEGGCGGSDGTQELGSERNAKIRVVQIPGLNIPEARSEAVGEGRARGRRGNWEEDEEDEDNDQDPDHFALSPSMMEDYLVTVVKQLVTMASSDDELHEIHGLDASGFSLLHYCSMYNLSSSIPLLLTRGADINLQAISGSTALHFACQAGHMSVVNILLLHNADVTVEDNEGMTPYDVAARSNKEEICNYISNVSAICRNMLRGCFVIYHYRSVHSTWSIWSGAPTLCKARPRSHLAGMNRDRAVLRARARLLESPRGGRPGPAAPAAALVVAA
jgi:hypothetical protein